MAYLAEFWLILESYLLERAQHKIFDENVTKNTTDCNLTNTVGITEFGSVMNKL